ncbi:hypothetical protein C8247_10195 [Paracidovorax avenae]|nr:hypothetical protein C8247_10195 [Paracidovorax avenae]
MAGPSSSPSRDSKEAAGSVPSPDAGAMASGHPALESAVRRSRKLLHRRALMAAAAGVVPVPGLDWAVDAALLTRLIPEINAEFGLTPEQIDRLTPHKREQVQKAVGMVGSALIGRIVTRELVMRALRLIGVRLTAQQAAKFVPLAGQAVSAALGYATLRYLGELHLRDCVQVAKAAGLLLPAPGEGAPPAH